MDFLLQQSDTQFLEANKKKKNRRDSVDIWSPGKKKKFYEVLHKSSASLNIINRKQNVQEEIKKKISLTRSLHHLHKPL